MKLLRQRHICAYPSGKTVYKRAIAASYLDERVSVSRHKACNEERLGVHTEKAYDTSPDAAPILSDPKDYPVPKQFVESPQRGIGS